MSYHHQFQGETEGIRPTAPVRWRQLDDLMGVFWQAEGDANGQGYYLSANPRITVFFTDVSSIRMANRNGQLQLCGRPMARVIYVPAGMPMWTSFTAPLVFSHLDIHLNSAWLAKTLAASVGRAEARDLMRRPVEQAEARDLEILARLLVDEVSAPKRRHHFTESLAGSLISGVFDLGPRARKPADGRLTAAQMRKLVARFDASGGRRVTVAEMAQTVRLSESWFSHVFKNTTGLTPLQWQFRQRIEQAQRMLVETDLSLTEITARLGFSDQAHLTRVFRQVTGDTPAAWRRRRLLQPPAPEV